MTCDLLVNACGNVTDEDSGDEDEVDNPRGSQHNAHAEIEVVVCQTEDDFSSADELPLSHFVKSNIAEKVGKKKKKKNIYHWVKQHIISSAKNVFSTFGSTGFRSKEPIIILL
ncbi:hypothetical protein ILUMI_25922 [Ignelater luminosus]|uniref:Uncharacterized protein n=1 Tax=Ignelater luminosus TaxID=2038154 RepID=A0A8K0C7I7_IGNLU|nr:hypothetical protein ILUMI_25922 [Ignelater luminosus]